MPTLRDLALREDIALVAISSRPFGDVPGITDRAVGLAKPFGARELLDAGVSGISKRPCGPEAVVWARSCSA